MPHAAPPLDSSVLPSSAPLELAGGRVARLWLPRGGALLLESGAARMTALQWLGNQCIGVPTHLQAGVPRPAEAAAWVRVEALTGDPARLRVLPAPAAPLRALWLRLAGLRRLAAGLPTKIDTSTLKAP